MADIMLLQDDATFKFYPWDVLKKADAVVASFITLGSTDAEGQAHYENLQQAKPAGFASLLNLIAAMKAIQLPSKNAARLLQEDSLG